MIDPQKEQSVDRPPNDDVTATKNDERRLPVLRTPSSAQDSKKSRRLWPWFLGAVAALVSVGLVFWQPWVAGPAIVGTEIVALAPVTRVLAVNGRIEALQSVEVRTLVSGPLISLSAAEGASVQAGDELAQIDPASQQAVLRQAIAGMDAALVVQAQAQATLARTLALGTNVSSAAREAAASAAQSTVQEVARATALVDQAQIQLERFTIRTPISGAVVALNVEPGQIVDPSTPLLTIADLSLLVVETDVDETYAIQIRTGLPAVLQLAGETIARDGQVRFVSRRVDAATGGLSVQLGFVEAVAAPIGLTVTANIVVDQRAEALTVPRAALLTTDAGPVVLVVVDGVAQSRAVSVIDWPAARLIVTEGLVPGDIVIADATGLIAGQAVQARQP